MPSPDVTTGPSTAPAPDAPPAAPAGEPDNGLRQLLTWTFIVMALVVLMAFGLVHVVTRMFDRPL